MAAFGAVTILMDALHQNFLQPTPLFPLRNKTKVKLLYKNLSSLRTSLEQDLGFRVGEYDEAMKGLEAQLRDVSVELRFQIEHQLRLFYLGKSMKLRLHSAQKLLPILKEAIKGGIETMDFNSVMEILGKHFTLPVSGMPPHMNKRVKSFCRQHQLFLYGKQYEEESEDDEQDSDDDDDDKECRLLLNIITLVWRVSSQIKKKVKSCFRRERKSDDDDDDEQESNNEQQIDDEEEAERRKQRIRQNLLSMMYMLYEAESVIRQEVRASYLNKYMKQRILATQRIRQLFIQGISLTSNINKHMLKVKNAYHQSNNSQNNNPASLRGLELDNIQTLEVYNYPSCEPLESLVYLYKVEALTVNAELGEFSTIYSMGMLSLENFWPSLKRLDLSNTNLKWEDMDVVGKLSKLEDLSLGGYAVKGRKWKPKDGGFRQLRFLYINSRPLQYWEATSNHFPVLEKLVLGRDIKLKEIPSDFVGITTLKSITLLYDCLESLKSSAVRIQKDREEYGDDTFVVDIFPG
nr:putative disease resistance RPP13-like protein 3 [Ipomoea trifida]